jgi:hypothetical protein
MLPARASPVAAAYVMGRCIHFCIHLTPFLAWPMQDLMPQKPRFYWGFEAWHYKC